MKIKVRNLNIIYVSLLTLLTIALVSCGGESNESESSSKTESMVNNNASTTSWESENGYGPVKKKLNLGPIDPAMAKEGEKIFESKCATCHKLDERYTGPAQRNVLERVTPEFFMNMVLNPDENLEKNKHARDMLAQYMTKMTNQNVTIKDARSLLEYFRLLDEELKSNQKTNQ